LLRRIASNRAQIVLGDAIGRGQFGEVFLALLVHPTPKHVAIKTLNVEVGTMLLIADGLMHWQASEELRSQYLHEIAIMKELTHEYIVSFIGFCV
jgi:serine/threonine protein kinase